jgi:hypothetical protein
LPSECVEFSWGNMGKLRANLCLLAATFLVAATSTGYGTETAVPLAAHRAFYRMTLGSAETSGTTSASGAMEYEVIDGCDGWAIQQRMDVSTLDRDGGETRTISDYSTWESKDGHEFRFHIAQTDGDKIVRVGYAQLRPGRGGFAIYSQPTMRRVILPPGTVFPMALTAAVLAAARRGDQFLSLPVFDGTATNAVENSFSIITSHSAPSPTMFAPLRRLNSEIVHVGYFDTDPTQQLPNELMSMRYWDNGVADELVIDFGNFTLKGALSQIELLPPHC